MESVPQWGPVRGGAAAAKYKHIQVYFEPVKRIWWQRFLVLFSANENVIEVNLSLFQEGTGACPLRAPHVVLELCGPWSDYLSK